MQVTDLLDLAKKRQGLATDMALAEALGISRSAVSAWRHGHKGPDTVQCATLAGLTGEPLARVLGIVGEARAISREEKSVWRKLAASAAGLFLLLAATLPAATPAEASETHDQAATEAFQPAGIGIMRSARGARIVALPALLQALPPGQGNEIRVTSQVSLSARKRFSGLA